MGEARNPTVSVIIPTYNRAHLVGRAIQSVLNQTYQDFELIVVDDGSTDNTEEVVKGFNDARIRYIRHDENKGLPAARNTGIEAARGEYIAFLDSDDEWLERKLEKQIALFEQLDSQVGVVYCRWYVMDDDTGFVRRGNRPAHRGNVWHHVLKGWGIQPSSAVIRRECFDHCGAFDESLPFWGDSDLWFRIAQQYHFDLVDEFLYIIHYHSQGQLSRDFRAKLGFWESFFEKWGATIKEHVGEQTYNSLRRRKFSSIYGYAILEDLRTSQRRSAYRKLKKLIELRYISLEMLMRLVVAFIAGFSIYDRLKNIWRKKKWKAVPLEELYGSQDSISIHSSS